MVSRNFPVGHGLAKLLIIQDVDELVARVMEALVTVDGFGLEGDAMVSNKVVEGLKNKNHF